MRRSISCMLAGLLIAGPLTVFAWAWKAHPPESPMVFWTLISLMIAGIVMLYDEIRGLGRAP
jgi:hypothetical protein